LAIQYSCFGQAEPDPDHIGLRGRDLGEHGRNPRARRLDETAAVPAGDRLPPSMAVARRTILSIASGMAA